MANTKIGGEKLRQTMITKYGSIEEFRKHMAEIGSQGGRNGHTGGFHNNPELAKRAGAIGGRVSRRRKNN